MSYYKMYTRMHWWPQHVAYKSRFMLQASPLHELFITYPPEDQGPCQPSFPINSFLDYSQLMKDLLRRRPELRNELGKYDSKVHKFLMRQQHWMNKGYTYKVAFDKVEEEMANNLQEIKTHAGMQSVIGSSTSIRNFYDHYQAVAEYEGKLKVKRLEKEIIGYKRTLDGVSIFENLDYVNKWENLNVQIKNRFNKDVPSKDFASKAKKLVKIHEEKVNKYDGLSGLSDNFVLWSAKEAFQALRSTNDQLLEDLKNLGVKLSETDEIDVSEVKNEELRKSLKSNKLVSLIFQNTFTTDPIELPLVRETEGEDPPYGELKPKPLVYDSENPYKQIYGRLPKDQYESQEDRIARLKRIWNENQTKTRDSQEQLELQKKAVDALRTVRLKVDQILVANKKPAVFPPNQEISKEDLLLTHKFDIEKINRFLNTDLEQLAEDEREKIELYETEKMVKGVVIVEEVEPSGLYTGKRSDMQLIRDEEDDVDFDFVHDNEKRSEFEAYDELEEMIQEDAEADSAAKEASEEKASNTLLTKKREDSDQELEEFIPKDLSGEVEYSNENENDDPTQEYDLGFSEKTPIDDSDAEKPVDKE